MAGQFGDLNIPLMPEDRFNRNALLSKIRAVLKLGYRIIALNTVVEFSATTTSKKAKRQDVQIPPPLQIILGEEDKSYFQGKEPIILNRITLVVTESSHVHLLTSPSVTVYDIIAVQPNTEKLFQTSSNSVEIDLISFDLTSSDLFSIKRQQTRLAMSHGIAFEINYSPAIRDATARQHTLSKGKFLAENCRGKNIIFSSGAQKVMEFRAPHDIMNLALLFSLTGPQGKDAVSTNIRNVLLHAEARRLGKGVISVVPMEQLLIHNQPSFKREITEKEATNSEPPKKKSLLEH